MFNHPCHRYGPSMAGGNATSNIFTLDGPTSTGSGLLRAAARFTARNERGLQAGFDLQARLEGALDVKLTEAARASFRGSASASVTAEAAACFPLDVFDFAGVIASLKFQAEARAALRLDAEFQPLRLIEKVLADHAATGWLPYVEVVSRQVRVTAGLQASAAVCVKAAAETKAGIRLFPNAGEPAGSVFVVTFGYGFIYGYSWGLVAEAPLPDPESLVRELFQVSARQLAQVFDEESLAHPEPLRSVLHEAADLVELALPALAGLLCTLVADLPDADRQTRLGNAVTALGEQLGRHLLDSLIRAALDGLEHLLLQIGLPADTDISNKLTALLYGLADAAVAGRSLPDALAPAIGDAVDALSALVLRGLSEDYRELVQDLAIGIWAGVSLLLADADTPVTPPPAAIRRFLTGAGVVLTDPDRLPARALAHVAGRLLVRAGAATWLGELTGLTVEQLLRLPREGLTVDPVEFLREFLAAVGSVLAEEVLDEIPPDAFGLPPEAVESVRTILRVAVEELPGLLGDIDSETVLRRLRERVGVGLLQTIGPPLVSILEQVAKEGFAQAVPAVDRLAEQAERLGDVVTNFPSGGPLDRFTSALADLGRESVDVTLGLPTSVMLRHLSAKLQRWRDKRLDVELNMLRQALCLQGRSSAELLDRLDSADVSVVVESLLALAEHHLQQIASITEFLAEDSIDLLGRVTVLPFEQAARLFAASVKFGFDLTAALVATLEEIAGDLDARIAGLEADVAAQTGAIAVRCGALADRKSVV